MAGPALSVCRAHRLLWDVCEIIRKKERATPRSPATRPQRRKRTQLPRKLPMGALRLDSTISCKVNSNPVTIFGHDGVAGHRHGREADFGTDGCNSFKKTLRPGGGGPRKRPQSGQRRRAPFWPRVRDRNRAPFWAKNRTFSFFFSCHGSDGTLAFRVHVAYRAKVLLD